MNKFLRLSLGLLAGNLTGALLTGFVMVSGKALSGSAAIVIWPSLLLIPFAIGLISAWVWKPLRLKLLELLLYSLLCGFVGLLVAALVFREGIICLIIIFPIFVGGIVSGALAGRIWFRNDGDRFNTFAAPLVLVAILIEPSIRGSHSSVVVDEIVIRQPPSKVWPHVLSFEPITTPPDYWLFKLGLPYPIETTNGGNFVGAPRSCRFSGDSTFEERVSEIEPFRKLTFDIIKMPPHPELMGHMDAHRGQFQLNDLGDGTTLLIGRTWYSLQVRPLFYFEAWTHSIFRAVHLRVMRNIKDRAESSL